MGELEIEVETLSLGAPIPTPISRSPKLPLVFRLVYGNTENVFLFLNYILFRDRDETKATPIRQTMAFICLLS